MFMVMVGEECPRISATTLAGSPAANMRDAAVCLASWRQMLRSSALVASFWKFPAQGFGTVRTAQLVHE
jgi:hypothetical protein